ncbi:4-alpha-glucanotransferase [Thioflexithrix psekupsensis]|uniref:4-alpha-glucanotransferase n=2 Tax=Thioflexithrix psekupsensis TaxID=1570016 RepID=A0A251XBE3_9GAMM|nr:4-alpha-glucanotransferase [Thioflexithrix psekupsensis]
MGRYSGIILHPTSLPGRYGIGELGDQAFQFVDFLAKSGQTLWQVLPLGPTSFGNSPYQCLSAFAGNPLLISIQRLQQQGFLPEFSDAVDGLTNAHQVDFARVIEQKMRWLRQAYQGFLQHATPEQHTAFATFAQKQPWLDTYTLFAALKSVHQEKSWHEWPRAFAQRDPAALQQFRHDHSNEIEFHAFLQFQFFQQWTALKQYANENHIDIIGDLPIFVAYDSADVWANPELFKLDAGGQPTVIAGVPPDYFSETGQRWGNPIYDWARMAQDDYAWWRARFSSLFELADWVRIDHFRGFEQHWEIPASEETAVNGCWVDGPKADFFDTVARYLGQLPIIAEDLGVITPEVEALRRHCGFPGMKVLQFAFFDDEATDFLPHNYEVNAVVYTGTHDNNTTRAWFESELSEPDRARLRRYTGRFFMGDAASGELMRLAWASVARIAIVPLQDVLNLGEDARMNRPGTTTSQQWGWRFTAAALTPEVAQHLSLLSKTYERFGRKKHKKVKTE